MNYCFEKFIEFKGIMSDGLDMTDGLDRIVASKK